MGKKFGERCMHYEHVPTVYIIVVQMLTVIVYMMQMFCWVN